MVLSAMLSVTMAAPSTVGVFFLCNVIIVAILITSSFKCSSDVQEEAAAASRFKDRNNTRVFEDEGVDDDADIVVADHEVTQTRDSEENVLCCSDDASDKKTGVLVVDEVSRAAVASSVVDSKLVVCRSESSTSVKDDDTNALFSSNESRGLMTAVEVSSVQSSAFTENQLRICNDDDNNDENDHENCACDDELKRRSEDFINQVVRQWKAERLGFYQVQVE